jgi:hypothetical protein
MARRLFKVRFELDPSDWHGTGSELLWVAPAVDPGTFELQNSPFHATGVSYLDIVAALPAEDSSTFNFERVVRHSGHSTYMILLEPDDPAAQAGWQQLKEMGCTHESASMGLRNGMRLLYSVDVPPTADHTRVYDVLVAGERSGSWRFQTGYDARTTPSSASQS